MNDTDILFESYIIMGESLQTTGKRMYIIQVVSAMEKNKTDKEIRKL